MRSCGIAYDYFAGWLPAGGLTVGTRGGIGAGITGGRVTSGGLGTVIGAAGGSGCVGNAPGAAPIVTSGVEGTPWPWAGALNSVNATKPEITTSARMLY